MKTVFYSLVFSIFLILASCGGEGTEAPSCDENTQQDCTIAGGGKGTQICLNGSWSECKPVCVDGDEIPCTTPCKTKGTKLCIAGDWGECIPPPEECNNKDDDCNNLTDDGLGKVECGLGECKHQTDKCSAGVEQSCNPFEGAGPEKCDGLDNNCDGQTDENLIQICSTACGQGTETCDEGVWINCTAKKPELEKCDGLDNDCNNKTDDGINCACTENDTQSCGTDEGECYPGVKKCENNKWGQCGGPNYVGSTAEKCNNKDDDCDGKTDGFTQTCVTACENGKETCVAGQWVNCTAKKPESEKCDGLDNDCNGKTDDGLTFDQWEQNETCATVRDLGEMLENSGVVEFKPNIYPEKDVDWFSFTAKEISDIWPPCGYFSKDPLKETCYYLDVFLKGIPAGADYDLTVYAEDCAGTGGKFESKEPGQKEDAVFIGWSGTLVASDDMKFYVEVKPKVAGAFSCKTYTLAIDVYSICPDDPDTGKCPWELSE